MVRLGLMPYRSYREPFVSEWKVPKEILCAEMLAQTNTIVKNKVNQYIA